MKPFVVEPRVGELKVVLAYQDAGPRWEDRQTLPMVIGGDEFMVRFFTFHLAPALTELGPISFEPGKLYTWRGEVCITGGVIQMLLASSGSWFGTRLFDPSFELERESQDELHVSAEEKDSEGD